MDAATRAELEEVVARALTEDVGEGDLTSLATVPEDARAAGTITQKEPGVLFGFDAAQLAFTSLDPGTLVEPLAEEGQWREAGPAMRVEARPGRCSVQNAPRSTCWDG